MRDAIIVGLGPAGLVSVLYLAKAGFAAPVLESDTGIFRNLRGSTFYPSSLDMLDRAFGDASNINNPLGEMGMYGGTRDQLNLAVKRVAVLRKEAGPCLLNLYAEEKLDVAMEYVQRISIQNKKIRIG